MQGWRVERSGSFFVKSFYILWTLGVSTSFSAKEVCIALMLSKNFFAKVCA